MEYFFEIRQNSDNVIRDTAVRFESCLNEFNSRFNFKDYHIIVSKDGRSQMYKIASEDDLHAFQVAFERKIWKDKKNYNALEETDGFHVKSEAVKNALSGAGMTLGELKLTRTGEKPSIAKAVNPSHYQSYISVPHVVELQWLEAKQYQRPWRDNPDSLIAAVLLQADKYLSRLGGKDNEVQEILKGIWYLKFVAAFIANGKKPIRVEEIDKILSQV